MYILAIDLGGMSAKCAIFLKADNKLLYRFEVKTILDKIIFHLVDEIAVFCQQQNINFGDICAIGISTPGFVNSKTGVVIKAGNLGWDNFPLKAVLEDLWKKPVFILNDANAAGYGEYFEAEGKKYHSLVFYTIGTGIGGAIIINGELVTGHQGFAGELGHGGWFQNEVICACQQKYCLEPVSSAKGITEAMQLYIKSYPDSALSNLQKSLGRSIEIKDIKELLSKDEATINLLKKALTPLANHMSVLIYALNPEAVIIGGGPSALGPILVDIIKDLVKQNTASFLYENCVFKTSKLQNDAGIYGTYYFTIQNLKL